MTRFRRPFLLMITLLIATRSGGQQEQDTLGLTDYPVPAWPPGGVTSATLTDKFVFLDLANNEYVLAYPENLGTPAFEKDGPGSLKISRYELQRNVEPVASVTVS